MSRKLAREAAFSLLFERELNKGSAFDTLEIMGDVLHTRNFEKKHGDYVKDVLSLFEMHAGEIDELIEEFIVAFKLNRISRVDLSIMRLAIVELQFIESIPYKVTINEAVELAKKYSTDKAPAYINGVLASVMKKYGYEK